MTQVHSGINIGLQYIRNTSEYIPKLQLHQHFIPVKTTYKATNIVDIRLKTNFSVTWNTEGDDFR